MTLKNKAVILRDVMKNFGPVKVLKNINLEVQEGEFVVFVGPSGCGKSTLLRLIAGLEQFSSGSLVMFGEDCTTKPAGQRDVAMVFQDYALYPHMTVRENLAFGSKLKKIEPSLIADKIKKTAQMLDLSEYLERKPEALSGGQRQRVAMGRAVMKSSKIFLYDEPLSNLDAKLRTKMRSEIKRFHRQQQSTSIYVTHDQLEAMTLADTLVVLKDGQIEQQGSPLELFEKPRSVFVATFIGTPMMNIFRARVEHQNGNLGFRIHEHDTFFSLTAEKSELVHGRQEILVGLRPSDITLADKINPVNPQWQTSTKIDFVETLGKNAYIHGKLGSFDLVGEIMGRHAPQPDDVVELEFNLNHVQLFDVKTELNLLHHP